MKNENEFNAWLSKEFRKLSPTVFAHKVADKFGIGIPDFHIWTPFRNFRQFDMECKFVRKLPGTNAAALKHPFTGEQQTFMESIELAGGIAVGLVCVWEWNCMVLIQRKEIPSCGNFSVSHLMDRVDRGWPNYAMSSEGVYKLLQET